MQKLEKNEFVIDSSALLALLYKEKGGGEVKTAIKSAQRVLISAVTYSETLSKLVDIEISLDDANTMIASFKMDVIAFSHEYAVTAASFRNITRKYGFSFTDRACLALAFNHQLPVLTADKAWPKCSLGVDIVLIR